MVGWPAQPISELQVHFKTPLEKIREPLRERSAVNNTDMSVQDCWSRTANVGSSVFRVLAGPLWASVTVSIKWKITAMSF